MIRALALSLLVACGGDEDLAEAHYIELIEDGECDGATDQGEAVWWYPDVPQQAVCDAFCCGIAEDTAQTAYCADADMVEKEEVFKLRCLEDCDWLEVRCIYVD